MKTSQMFEGECRDSRKVDGSCWDQQKYNSSLCSYKCFLSSTLMLPNKFWDVGTTGRKPLGEADWGQDRSMEAHWEGLVWEESLQNSE